ncbi:MAG: VOC family protein [Roseitalea sp.]|jgi:catechol 2,3-dioxygenase-like lactoylglutathione lyase family enzyme|nr:VOC family protein [Roseitalea sp.]MBO6723188.1 VOC family protein [Roseitalea sp.]MBO6745259.1 VOC family protein [Roseitalea sp.]
MSRTAPLTHISLAIDDIDGAMAFFGKALGFSALFRDDDLTDEVARLASRDGLRVKITQMSRADDGCVLELIEFNDNGTVPASGAGPVPMAHICFAVEDLERSLAEMKAAGAVPLGEVVPFPEARSVYLRVPGNAIVEIIQRYRSGDSM